MYILDTTGKETQNIKYKTMTIDKIWCNIKCRGKAGKMGPILEISMLSLIQEIFRTSFNLLLRVGIQALLSKGLILDNCKHSRVNSRFTKISNRPILPRCLGQDERA